MLWPARKLEAGMILVVYLTSDFELPLRVDVAIDDVEESDESVIASKRVDGELQPVLTVDADSMVEVVQSEIAEF